MSASTPECKCRPGITVLAGHAHEHMCPMFQARVEEPAGREATARTEKRPEVRSSAAEGIGREGMLTVWDNDGWYVGCMGVETWLRLLEEGTPAGREATDVPFVKGPSTFTEACTCGSQMPGYHRMDCGVYGALSEPAGREGEASEDDAWQYTEEHVRGSAHAGPPVPPLVGDETATVPPSASADSDRYEQSQRTHEADRPDGASVPGLRTVGESVQSPPSPQDAPPVDRPVGDETEALRDEWLEAFWRAWEYVPLGLYDEHRKPAEAAFAQMLGVIQAAEARVAGLEAREAELRSALEAVLTDATVNYSTFWESCPTCGMEEGSTPMMVERDAIRAVLDAHLSREETK